MVEFSLVMLIFFIFVFALIEFARHMMLQTVMSKAAHLALERAVSIPNLEYNLLSFPAANDQQGNSYAEFAAARDQIINIARGYAVSGSITDHAVNSAARLMPFRLEDGVTLVDVMIFRPGDSYTLLPFTGPPILIQHPTVPSGAISNTTNIRMLMRNEPIIVMMRAELNLSIPLPLFESIPIEVIAGGYREEAPTGAFAEPLASIMISSEIAIS